MTKPKYNIGDIVYHVLPESPKGLVVNGTYSLLNNVWQYLVAFSPTEEQLRLRDKIHDNIALLAQVMNNLKEAIRIGIHQAKNNYQTKN